MSTLLNLLAAAPADPGAAVKAAARTRGDAEAFSRLLGAVSGDDSAEDREGEGSPKQALAALLKDAAAAEDEHHGAGAETEGLRRAFLAALHAGPRSGFAVLETEETSTVLVAEPEALEALAEEIPEAPADEDEETPEAESEDALQADPDADPLVSDTQEGEQSPALPTSSGSQEQQADDAAEAGSGVPEAEGADEVPGAEAADDAEQADGAEETAALETSPARTDRPPHAAAADDEPSPEGMPSAEEPAVAEDGQTAEDPSVQTAEAPAAKNGQPEEGDLRPADRRPESPRPGDAQSSSAPPSSAQPGSQQTGAASSAPTQQVSGADAAPALAPQAQGTPAAHAAGSAGASSQPVPQPLNAQLSTPVSQAASQLVSTGAGERTMTIRVAPESLGPVTVRAHMTSEGLRIELFAPHEQGREALRGIVADLRRDLAGMGVSTGASQVSISDQEAPAPSGSSQQGQQQRSADQQLMDAQAQDREQLSRRPGDDAPAAPEEALAEPEPEAAPLPLEPDPSGPRAQHIPGSLDLMV
ncbi:flagellar hook-length control protein FliK [Nesterenkonia populi]|uniref:flagellar hook-length control protein FliK n=1 Tax=Nesterenkonia populi TaxID=1591087 RepID=UPI0011BF8888|nr:flagellar hook-length control protein FliK [Nesterenkonia populi]